ncbi:hypothetical protein P0D69_39280 [Paraburkholderia sediminicola]|uniref:hypothetical protein n=1 Tax=Paraburkholderia sediminicola TaxID=458836 RepID=UPI0038BCB8E2
MTAAEGETIAEGKKRLKIFLAVFTTLYIRLSITPPIELQNNSNKLHKANSANDAKGWRCQRDVGVLCRAMARGPNGLARET